MSDIAQLNKGDRVNVLRHDASDLATFPFTATVRQVFKQSRSVEVMSDLGRIWNVPIEDLTVRSLAVDDLEFQLPDCTVCDEDGDMNTEGGSIFCDTCGTSWDKDGRHGERSNA